MDEMLPVVKKKKKIAAKMNVHAQVVLSSRTETVWRCESNVMITSGGWAEWEQVGVLLPSQVQLL